MSIKENIEEINKSIIHLEQSGKYDGEKLCYSLKHLTSQLEFFYCHLVKENQSNETYYQLDKKPTIHQLAYFNIGRGFPKELMDGHWCYILKDLGYKTLVIPCTSVKELPCNEDYEMDIKIKKDHKITSSRIQLSDIRAVDNQRLDLRKEFLEVITDRQVILDFINEKLF